MRRGKGGIAEKGIGGDGFGGSRGKETKKRKKKRVKGKVKNHSPSQPLQRPRNPELVFFPHANDFFFSFSGTGNFFPFLTGRWSRDWWGGVGGWKEEWELDRDVGGCRFEQEDRVGFGGKG